MTPAFAHAIFAADLRTCTVILVGGLCYDGLRVKKMMVTKTDAIYRVLVQCEGDCGSNIMVAFDEEDVLRMRKSR